MQERTVSLIGKERYDRLVHSSVLVVGVGGVGGYVVEMLARAGVGHITIVDGDVVDVSNINRQIIALHSTIGKAKVDIMSERIHDINGEASVTPLRVRVTRDNVGELLDHGYDYVVDCIDSVPDKVALIVAAKERNMRIISAMGAGNKYKDVTFKITDIYKTQYDKLARKMRKLLKDAGIKKLDVCYSESECESVEGVIGSISYGPPLAGVTIAQHVIRTLMERE